MLRRVGLRNIIIVGLVRSPLSRFFLSVNDRNPKDKIFGLYKAFNHSRIFDKAVFCFGEKQGYLSKQ